MNCPKCGTWNPDDKDVCWRCQTELPKPLPEKKKSRQTIGGFPMWVWIAIVLFFAATTIGQCFVAQVPMG